MTKVVVDIDDYMEALRVRDAEIKRLREALRPFAKLFLWPDDLGSEASEDIKADEDWSEEANDESIEDVWVKQGDIRKARAVLGEGKE